MFSTGVIFLAVLISTALAGPWANICAGKSSNEIRTCDSHGCGRYTAQSHRPHQGVDVLCSDGSTVYAPFTGMIVAQEKPYKDKNAINNGVRLSGRGTNGKQDHAKVQRTRNSYGSLDLSHSLRNEQKEANLTDKKSEESLVASYQTGMTSGNHVLPRYLETSV
uniref:Leukocyte cell derived chemotaxin 2 n=1 Tax=Equus asinus TaxID=9793 RepID=A0A9L0JV32_EQUAS